MKYNYDQFQKEEKTLFVKVSILHFS